MNTGARNVRGVNQEGRATAMNYAVADIAVALDSVSQMCDRGAAVVFHKSGGYVLDASGQKSSFCRNGDTYVRSVWIEKAPFTGPRA